MDASTQPESLVSAELREQPGGRVGVVLRGRLDVQTTGYLWHELERRLGPLRISELTVDASQLDFYGGIGIALLRYLSEGGITPGARVTVHGLSADLERLMETFTAEDFRAYRPHAPPKQNLPEEVGSVVRELLQDLREEAAFIGSVVAAIPWVLARPKQLRWGEIRQVLESAGANALPVVALFSGLVGMVLVLEGTHPLAQFGAQLFMADMLGFAFVRDAGPLVAGIMLVGRSGSAFAAELGTMKVNQELDALTTMGLDPIRFLVVQRVLAASLLMPLLALYAMLAGIVGGILVMRFQGFSPLLIYNQIIARVHLGDLGVGLTKSLIFGLIVGSVGCLRGLQTKEGPQAVGVSATRAVVAGILLIILANTLYSAVQFFFT